MASLSLNMSVSSSPGSASQQQSAGQATQEHQSQDHRSRSSSLDGPSYSPITPTLPHANLPSSQRAQNGQTRAALRVLTHNAQEEQSFIPPLQLSGERLDFDNNPDVIALRAAISVLQVQKSKAENDMKAIRDARNMALEDPAGFVAALNTGMIRTMSDNVLSGQWSKSDSDVGKSDDVQESEGDNDVKVKNHDDPNATIRPSKRKQGPWPAVDEGMDAVRGRPDQSNIPVYDENNIDNKEDVSEDSTVASPAAQRPSPSRPSSSRRMTSTSSDQSNSVRTRKNWPVIPGPQNVVRVPAINWASYGIVGEPLDKIQAEEVARPSRSEPAVIAAPYSVFRDTLTDQSASSESKAEVKK
jgi:hypothetical protein